MIFKMKIFNFVCILFCILLFKINFIDCNVEKNGQLIFAHVLFRHGDRTPIDPYPLDPYKNLSYWPTGWGQLTNLGKQQHFQLGQWLRERYTDLINETYTKEEVFIQSTDVDRTLMSALSNLAGLYPPVGKQIWNNNIQWQPIPVHTIPEKLDYILAAKRQCPSYDYYLNKLKNSDEYQQLNKQLKGLYKYLTEHSGKQIGSIEGVQNIYNCLFIETIYNKTLPQWTKEVYPDKMKWISARSFATNTYTTQLARLKSGPLLKEILDRFVNKTISKLKPNRNLWIYSGHDTTIANLLNTMGLFEYHSPPYAACVMLELRLVKGIPFISVFYKNTTMEPKKMYIPNCGENCPLQKMFEIYHSVLPTDWISECQISMLNMTYEEADLQPALIIIIIAALTTLIILIILGALTYFRRKNYQDARWYLRIDS